MYYFESTTQIKEELRRRRRERGTIRSVLNQHIEKTYGIQGFSNLVSSSILANGTIHNGNCDTTASELDTDEVSYGVLARQVPGLTAEDIACHLVSLQLGITPFPFAFSRDVFHSGSNDKLFRVKVPFVSWSKKGNMVITHKKVITSHTSSSYTDLDMMRLDRLEVNGSTLREHHRGMQAKFFRHLDKPYMYGDISYIWGDILARTIEAGRGPKEVWKTDESGKDRPHIATPTPDEARSLLVRPSSHWYYHLYLSMFLDGKFVLLETYDNEKGGVPEARRLFEKEMDAIRNATGYMPLVVKTYPLRPDMLYVNNHIIESPDKAAVALGSTRYWSEDTVSMTRYFADQALSFGRVQ